MSIFPKFILVLVLFIFSVFPVKLNADEKSAFLDEVVLILDNGFEYNVNVKINNGDTVGEVLEKAKIKLNKEDIIFPKKKEIFLEGTKIIIERATPIVLSLYEEKNKVFTHKEKVREVLIEQGVDFKKNDLINFNFEEAVFPGMEIEIWEKPELELELELEPVVEGEPEKPKEEPPLQIDGSFDIGYASWYSYLGGDYCASTAYPMGTKLLVTNVANGSQVVVTVNDRGPFRKREFIIDLDSVAFSKIGSLEAGVIKTKVEELLQ